MAADAAPEGLDGIRTWLEAFSEWLLRPYLTSLNTRRFSREHKVVNDLIWQTVSISPFETVFLDSPIVQRLRRIRQLGVVHWVYPNAVHSRFEHSIGALHQVSQLCRAINSDEELVPESFRKLLRLTALCHDLGHGVMSHVSENALRNRQDVRRLERQFARQFGEENANLSEIAAYYMIGSPAFGELLKAAQEITGEHDLPDHALEKMQRCVVGQVISDELPLIHELISGPFDADKLDYLPRDAHICGVPVVTDIPRLTEKVKGIRIREDELPPRVAQKVQGGKVSYLMMGIALSGGRTLDELILGRTLLFDKIYRHHKVRAVEAMVASILLQTAEILSPIPALAGYCLVDEELLDLSEERLRTLAGRDLTQREAGLVRVAADIAGRLGQRNLFARCFSFSKTMPLDPYSADAAQRTGLERLQREAANYVERAKCQGSRKSGQS